MSRDPGDPGRGEPADPLVDELHRRIDLLHHESDPAFGPFTLLDWVIVVGCGLVLPYALYLAFLP